MSCVLYVDMYGLNSHVTGVLVLVGNSHRYLVSELTRLRLLSLFSALRPGQFLSKWLTFLHSSPLFYLFTNENSYILYEV